MAHVLPKRSLQKSYQVIKVGELRRKCHGDQLRVAGFWGLGMTLSSVMMYA